MWGWGTSHQIEGRGGPSAATLAISESGGMPPAAIAPVEAVAAPLPIRAIGWHAAVPAAAGTRTDYPHGARPGGILMVVDSGITILIRRVAGGA